LRRLRREALAALSGALLVLSFPKFGHWAVAWVALLPLLLALPGAGAGRALRLGYLTGAVSGVGLLYWTALVVTQYGGLALPVSVAIMVLLCLAVALFPALFAWLVGAWLEALGPRALLLAPVAWVATEILRSHTLLRFAWCLLGYSQAENTPMIQIAAYTAVYGVSFVVCASSACAAAAACERVPRVRVAILAGGVALLGAVAGQGVWAASRPLRTDGGIVAGLVQASIGQDEKWRPGLLEDNVSRHERLTRQAAQAGARLVVWPESAVPFLFDEDPGIAAELRGLTRELGVDLLFGNDDHLRGRDGEPHAYVGAKLLRPDGRLALRYHKMRLVPFGEYVPLQPLLTLGGRFGAKLVREVSDFTPGDTPSVAELDGHRLSAFICYEAIFPDLVRRFAASGAELLVNLTNDAWYGTTSAPYQHLAMATFRAIETGKYLLRDANTGISAVVDPRGRVLSRTRLFEPALLVSRVPFVSGSTFYVRHGDVFAWGCLAAAAGITAALERRRRSSLPRRARHVR
jgi:apolipoprotein N-acyltransferase